MYESFKILREVNCFRISVWCARCIWDGFVPRFTALNAVLATSGVNVKSLQT